MHTIPSPIHFRFNLQQSFTVMVSLSLYCRKYAARRCYSNTGSDGRFVSGCSDWMGISIAYRKSRTQYWLYNHHYHSIGSGRTAPATSKTTIIPHRFSSATSGTFHSCMHQRTFSDQVTGYSLTAASPAATVGTGTKEEFRPTAKEASIGGVWALTSEKRDKLGELRTELESEQTLDDAATSEQLLDLYLVDGIELILKEVDGDHEIIPKLEQLSPSASSSSLSHSGMEAGTLEQQQQEQRQQSDTVISSLSLLHLLQPILNALIIEDDQGVQASRQLTESEWEDHLNQISFLLDDALSTLPASRYLRDIRDFYDASSDSDNNNENNDYDSQINRSNLVEEIIDSIIASKNVFEDDYGSSSISSSDKQKLQQQFRTQEKTLAENCQKSVLRYRLLLTKAAVEHLRKSWKVFTTISDADVDRAAVSQQQLESVRTTIPQTKVDTALRTFLLGSCHQRFDAMWKLMDHDNDGLLDESEMKDICYMCLKPVQTATEELFKEAIEASPVRIVNKSDNIFDAINKDDNNDNLADTKKMGWRQRRIEKKHKKLLLKMSQKAIGRCFEDEVEMPKRLRCMYSWANKQHQGNKNESILVDEDNSSAGAGFLSGKKRYVELRPKIAIEEFREVQQIHFQHWDQIGAELCKSFREDLLVLQGKGRQNRELMRDAAIFMTVVCGLDYIILSL